MDCFGKGEKSTFRGTHATLDIKVSSGRVPWLGFSCRVEGISLSNVVKKLQKILLWYVSNLRLKKYFYFAIYGET